MRLHIEDNDWTDNKTKDNTIQLHIPSRSFAYTATLKKGQCIGFIFLLGERVNDSIVTKYKVK